MIEKYTRSIIHFAIPALFSTRPSFRRRAINWQFLTFITNNNESEKLPINSASTGY